MTDERAVMLVKKVTYFGEFSYLNGSCIKYYCYVFEFLESFGFKKLLELLWTLVYVFQRSMKYFLAAANFAIAKQVNKIKLLYVCL